MKKRLNLVLLVLVIIIYPISVNADIESRAITTWDDEPKGSHSFFIASSKISISEITFSTNDNIINAKMIVDALDDIPSSLPKIYNSYDYLAIGSFGISQDKITDNKIKFRVSKDWIEHNSFKNGIKSYSFSARWDELETNFIYSDSLFYYYECKPKIFSYFAIGGEKKIINITENLTDYTAPVIIIPEKNIEQLEINNTKNGILIKLFGKNADIASLALMILGLLLSLIFIGSLFGIYIKGNIYDNVDDIQHFIEEELSEGIKTKEIENELESAGWPKHLVEKIVNSGHVPIAMEVKIKAYINLMKSKKISDDKIKSELIKKGWDDKIVERLLSKVTSF